MTRRYDWPPYDPTLAALPVPAPDGELDRLAAEWRIPRPTLEWRLHRLRAQAGRTAPHPRAWTPEADARVIAAVQALARELGRTPGAVISRALALGIEP